MHDLARAYTVSESRERFPHGSTVRTDSVGWRSAWLDFTHWASCKVPEDDGVLWELVMLECIALADRDVLILQQRLGYVWSDEIAQDILIALRHADIIDMAMRPPLLQYFTEAISGACGAYDDTAGWFLNIPKVW